ncbi:MAG TPA: hypothetical protein VI893_08330 [Thermoplasmata archaeon]|nr:hypothetical protein [Thermoplasmata archaeon]
MKKLLEGILHVASVEEPDGFALNSYLFAGEKWSLLIDPPPHSDALAKEVEPWRVEYILCTSKATFPDAVEWRSTLPGSKIVLHIWDAEDFGNKKGREVDRPYLHDFYMKEAVRVIHAPGATPGSSVAVMLNEPRVLFAGDLLHVDNGEVKRSAWFDGEMGAMTIEKIVSQDWGFEYVLARRTRGPTLPARGSVGPLRLE